MFTLVVSWMLVLTATLHPTEMPPWQHPSIDREPFTNHFSAPVSAYGPGHRGIDFDVAREKPLVAPVDGVVHFSGTVADRSLITIRVNDNTLLTLEPVESDLVQGEGVSRGDVIGSVSSGGHCGVSCVHIGVRIDGVYVSPLRFFVDKPVLLPYGEP